MVASVLAVQGHTKHASPLLTFHLSPPLTASPSRFSCNLVLLILQGQWGVTAAEEEEENQRIHEFQESIPKMCSQLRILTHFYQVCVRGRKPLSDSSPCLLSVIDRCRQNDLEGVISISQHFLCTCE